MSATASRLAAVRIVIAMACLAYASGAAAAGSRSDEYAWRVFVALNRPSGPAATGIDRPAAWETWPTRNDLLREDGADPGRYEDVKAGNTAPGRFEKFSAKDLPNVRHIEAGKMVPGPEPVSLEAPLTEIRFNRAAFEYIRSHHLYSLQGQLQQLETGAVVAFPSSARIIKARWRPITETQRSRYHTLELQRADGSRQLWGLVALHVATRDLPNWFWATFEHEDNPTRPGGEPWLAASHDSFACRGARPDCNRAPSGLNLEGTVWSHYRLRGTMTRFVDASGNPQRLANSDLESGFQATSSCMTCHARAAMGLVGGTPVHLPIFAPTANPVERRGYVGNPQTAWYRGGPGDASNTSRLLPLDFVWSLALLRENLGAEAFAR